MNAPSFLNKLWSVTGIFTTASLLFFCGAPVSARADGTDTWHWRNPLPTANNLQASAYGNGVFVCVGALGCLQVSSNGVSWLTPPQPTTNNLSALIYGNGLFVAVGAVGTILTSPDGVTWTAATSGTSNNLEAIAWNNSIFLATGAAGTILTSTNGTQWSSPNQSFTHDLNWIAQCAGQFVIAAPPNPSPLFIQFGSPAIMLSADGSTWSTNNLPDPSNCRGGNVYKFTSTGAILVGYVEVYNRGDAINAPFTEPCLYTSTDGTSWNINTSWRNSVPLTFYRNLNSANGYLFEQQSAGGTNTTFVSADGQSWTLLSTPATLGLNNLSYGAGQYLSVGSVGNIFSSPDGTNWAQMLANTSTPLLSSIASSTSGVMVAVGGLVVLPDASLVGSASPILVCTNGSTFDLAPGAPSFALSCVAYGTTNFVAVGAAGTLQRSLDGLTWAARPSGTTNDLRSICFGNGLWVTVGSGGVVTTSGNSLVWSLRSSGTGENFNSVVYGGGQFVAVGQLGTVATSPDGINWTLQFVDTTSNLNQIVYGNGMFVAVGAGGTVVTSTDGANWTDRSSGVSSTLYGIGFSGNEFVTFAYSGQAILSSYPNINTILHSYDGVSWSKLRSPADWRIIGITAVNGTFMAVGDAGAILQSDVVSTLPILTGHFTPGSNFSLSVLNSGGLNFKIQSRTNAASGTWSDLLTVTNSPTIVTWTNTNSVNSQTGFYRTVAP